MPFFGKNERIEGFTFSHEDLPKITKVLNKYELTARLEDADSDTFDIGVAFDPDNDDHLEALGKLEKYHGEEEEEDENEDDEEEEEEEDQERPYRPRD